MDPLTIFRLLAKEFSKVEDDEVLMWIDFVKPLISKKKFGKMYSRAVVLIAAHKMKLNMVGSEGNTLGAAFGISSYTEGSTSVSFSNTSTSSTDTDSEYMLTQYGSQYLSLRNMCIMPMVCGGEETCL